MDIPLFPLGLVLFPTHEIPLHVFEERYRSMITDCLEGEGVFGVIRIIEGTEVGGLALTEEIGTLARITMHRHLEDGRSLLLARGEQRFRIRHRMPDDPYPMASVDLFSDNEDADEVPDLLELRRHAATYRALLAKAGIADAVAVSLDADLETASWQLASLLLASDDDRQALLGTSDSAERLVWLDTAFASHVEHLERALEQRPERDGPADQ